jgi:predicted nucleic acid-binding protein
MSLAVLDSSALLELLIGGPGADEVDRTLARGGVHAPVVFDAECMSTLRRWVLQGRIEEAHARNMLLACRAARVRRMPLRRLLAGAWELRENVTAFDALYVALARLLGAPLVTADARLAGAPGLGVPVTLLPR